MQGEEAASLAKGSGNRRTRAQETGLSGYCTLGTGLGPRDATVKQTLIRASVYTLIRDMANRMPP